MERGANDSDWSPLKEAARKLAFAEDRAVFEGYASAGFQGIGQSSSNPGLRLPADVKSYPDVVAQAVSQLRLAGVNGPYALLLSADSYTAAAEGSDDGYPVLRHIQRLVAGKVVWAPAIDGGVMLTTRGGDFELHTGQDISIGYLNHTETAIQLYLQETFTFLPLTAEAAVVLLANRVRRSVVKMPQCLTLVQSDVIGLITFDLVLRVLLARMMDIAFVVHLARMHLHDTTTDPASFGIPTYVVADFEFLAHN